MMELHHFANICVLVVIIFHAHLSGALYVKSVGNTSRRVVALVGTLFVSALAFLLIYWNW